MTIQQVLQNHLADLSSQQTQYQQDITNLLAMVNDITLKIQEINTWLAANPV